MNPELALAASRLAQAITPEEVFGELAGNPAEKVPGLKKAYRQLAKTVHPDVYPDREDQQAAQAAFTQLAEWFSRAERKIWAGEYGLQTGTAGPETIILPAPGAPGAKIREYRIENAYTDGRSVQSLPWLSRRGGPLHPNYPENRARSGGQ